jgi:hypothetical protein
LRFSGLRIHDPQVTGPWGDPTSFSIENLLKWSMRSLLIRNCCAMLILYRNIRRGNRENNNKRGSMKASRAQSGFCLVWLMKQCKPCSAAHIRTK